MIPDFANSLSRYVIGLRTGVFWDVEDCPIPNGLSPALIFEKMKLSLRAKGYSGVMSIYAYADAEKQTFSDDVVDSYRKAGIHFLPDVPGDKYERLHRMIHDLFFWSIDSYCDHGKQPAHVIVISNNIQGDVDFYKCLQSLSTRGYNAFLVQPGATPSEKLESSEWPAVLLNGGEVIGLHRSPMTLIDTDSEE